MSIAPRSPHVSVWHGPRPWGFLGDEEETSGRVGDALGRPCHYEGPAPTSLRRSEAQAQIKRPGACPKRQGRGTP